MLMGDSAELSGAMVHRFLVTISFVCCALIVASFAFFAADEASGASTQQVAEISTPAPTAPSKQVHHGAFRRFVDSAASDLTYPFHSLAQTSSQWGNQLLLLVLGLAVYGVGLGYLARYSSGLP
jgi:hypothetical protein